MTKAGALVQDLSIPFTAALSGMSAHFYGHYDGISLLLWKMALAKESQFSVLKLGNFLRLFFSCLNPNFGYGTSLKFYYILVLLTV